MKEYIQTLEEEFLRIANPNIAIQQKSYMKNKFEFFGIKSPERKLISRPFLLKGTLPPKRQLEDLIKILWKKPQREFQYFAHALVFKYKKEIKKKDLALFEFMIVNKPWWDSIDFIAPNMLGHYFKLYPEMRDTTIKKWLASNNIWLQRSCILFQLKYKHDLDTEFLSYIINSLLGSKEFFINKAIGWVLREYGKSNPTWVLEFTDKTALSNLSRKEALRIILKER